MRKSKINRFLQEPGHCAIAACATMANYYNKDIDYDIAKKIAKKKVVKDLTNGLDSGEIGKLLNELGFKKVSIISTDLNYLDYSWNKLKKNKLIEELDKKEKVIKRRRKEDCSCSDYQITCVSMSSWLKMERYDNNLIIDYDFGKYIRQSIDNEKPLIITFSWTAYFKFEGEDEEHAVSVYNYNKRGVSICDSHHEYYKYKLKKYRSGFYNIPWEHLIAIIGTGDIYLPDDFEK